MTTKELKIEIERLSRIADRFTHQPTVVTSQDKVDTAIALAKQASETATALASAKAQSDITSALTSNNIESIKGDIREIKDVLKSQEVSFVPILDFKEHLKTDDNHEVRLKLLEVGQARLMAYGTAMIFGVGILQFILGKFLN